MVDNTHAAQHDAADATQEVGHHVALWKLVLTLAVLLALTWVTYAVTYVNFGDTINLWIALLIATVKASLVALYFMHLRYDRPIAALILIAALFFVAVFIGAATMDSLNYQPNVQAYRDVDPNVNYAPLLAE